MKPKKPLGMLLFKKKKKFIKREFCTRMLAETILEMSVLKQRLFWLFFSVYGNRICMFLVNK